MLAQTLLMGGDEPHNVRSHAKAALNLDKQLDPQWLVDSQLPQSPAIAKATARAMARRSGSSGGSK